MRSPLGKQHRVTSPYGMRLLNGKQEMHNGIDLVPQDGKHPTELFSAVDGTVVDMRSTVPDSHTGVGVTSMVTGNYVNIRTREGYTVIYRHLKANSVTVKLNQTIKVGEKIGVMGTTGQSTGVHLHYEIRDPKGASIDPAGYIGNDIQLAVSVASSAAVQVGDKVKVVNAVTYDGKTFRVWFDKYDVLQINGDRVVIGVGDIVTAAVRVEDIKKV